MLFLPRLQRAHDRHRHGLGVERRLRREHPDVHVGFGIKDKASFDAVCQLADGAIIGSAYIKVLENSTNVNAATKNFLSSILH